ncbi:MAG TPA: autotransporter domain-containing protein [Herbaspirillum sp.]|nr:autotransporter domain-containing protein [Herbaspirillum sp.]
MKKPVNRCPKQKALTLAMTAALLVMAQAAVAQTIISTPTTGPFQWTSGDVSVTSTISSGATGIATNAAVGTLTNTGSISGSNTGIANNGGAIGVLINSGTISSGTINNGTITANYGINNNGHIILLDNTAGATIHGFYAGISNVTTIDTLSNDGTISGITGIKNFFGMIGTLTNNGTISGSQTSGIDNNAGATIGTLINNGIIIGPYNGIGSLNGTFTTLTNSGMISGGHTGIFLNGTSTVGTLTNSGTITGPSFAIDNEAGASLGPVTNSGMIAGNIVNRSGHDLSISGGTGTTFGTLTGYGGGSSLGVITNTASNVAFGAGNLLLNDNINVGSNAVNNTGTAVLQVNQPVIITGNYNQGLGATLQIGVASGATTLGAITDTGYGRLVVTGNSTIASGSSVTLQSNGYAFAAGQRYVVIDTTGAAVYNQGSLHYSINGGSTLTVTGSVVSNGSHSDLMLSLLSSTPAPTPTPAPTSTPTPSPVSIATATAPNAVASLNGLLSYTGISDPALLNMYDVALGALSPGSTATANRIGKQLGPTQTGTAAAAPTIDALNVVSGHVDALRLAQAGRTGSGVATGEGAPQSGVWGQAFGGHASQNERDQVDGYSANYGGLLIGVDKALNDNWRAGGVFTYSNTAADSTGDTTGDTTRINSYGLIGYASYTGSPWYVNLSGGVVQQQYDTTRQVNFQRFSGTANGHFSGQQYVARAEAGYPLALGSVTLTPLANLTYSYQNQGSYTESGGNGAALAVDAAHANSVKSGLGAKLEKSFSRSYGEIVPDLQLQWIHEYDHTAQATGASFAADPTGQTAFTTMGATPVSDLADISLGVTLLKANNLSLSARYELQAGSGFVSQTGIVRLRQLF